MIGAIAGDIVGSVYEWDNIKTKEFTEITHNHPEGIKGVQSVAACIFLARTGSERQSP